MPNRAEIIGCRDDKVIPYLTSRAQRHQFFLFFFCLSQVRINTSRITHHKYDHRRYIIMQRGKKFKK